MLTLLVNTKLMISPGTWLNVERTYSQDCLLSRYMHGRKIIFIGFGKKSWGMRMDKKIFSFSGNLPSPIPFDPIYSKIISQIYFAPSRQSAHSLFTVCPLQFIPPNFTSHRNPRLEHGKMRPLKLPRPR
jgi:hypothetical protein